MAKDQGLLRYRSIRFLAIVLLALTACATEPRAPDEDSQAQPTAPPALDNPRAEVVGDFLDNFQEGSELAEAWPAQLLALPPGAQPVASIASTALGQDSLAASVVFYSVGQSGAETADYLERELPALGWSVQDRQDRDGYSELTAEGHDYLLLVTAGRIPSRPDLASGAVIDLEIVLVDMGASP